VPKREIVVNGTRRSVTADDDVPLLWILRDVLGLTGTKYGCGAGLCGACTVLMDGAAIRSCQTPLAVAAGHEIVTIEGLSKDGDDPCQRAWLEEDVAQCGYCQPGMILEIRALLDGTKRPSNAEIDRALSDHVCRCGSYPRIRKAARLAATLGVKR